MCFFKTKKDKCDIEKEIEGLLNIAINKYLSISHSIVCEEGFEPINVHSVNIVDYSFNLVDSGTKYFSFMHALSDYRDMLMKEGMVSFIITNLEKSKLRIEGRVKNFNSISSKIEYYVYMKDERGKIPIYKCLNDLYGLRAIIDDSMQLSDLYDCISKICSSIMPSEKIKIRVIDSSKKEYNAVHVYIRKDNYSLPWEIQFWLKKDDRKNRISHKKYKQAYTTWERDINEGTFVNTGVLK